MNHQTFVCLLLVLVELTAVAPGGEERKQEAAKAKAVKLELKKLAGTWELVYKGFEGQILDLPEPPPLSPIKRDKKEAGMPKGKHRVTWLEDGTIVVPGRPKDAPKSKHVVDPTARPKTIDQIFPPQKSGKQTITVGIYDFMNEDELHICLAAVGYPRPTDFTFNSRSGRMFQIWRRVKDKK